MLSYITDYKKFLSQVDRVEAIEGDSEFASKEFITLNKEKGIRVDTSVAADNHYNQLLICIMIHHIAESRVRHQTKFGTTLMNKIYKI